MLKQEDIAAHLDLSQGQASVWLSRLGLDLEAGLDAIRIGYIRALRKSAAQHVTPEREALDRARREIAELRLAREKGELVDAKAVRRRAFTLGRAARDAVMNLRFRLDPLLANEHDAVKRAEIWDRETRAICSEIAAGVAYLPNAEPEQRGSSEQHST